MTTAERLLRLKQDFDDVKNSGGTAIDEATIIEKTVSGKSVTLNDISEVPHEIKVKLTSDTITDFSDTIVTQYGKNIVEFGTLHPAYHGVSITVNEDGTITANGKATSLVTLSSNKMPLTSKEACIAYYVCDGAMSGMQGSVVFYDKNGTVITQPYFSSAQITAIPENAHSIKLEIYILSGTTVNNFTFTPMVNFGTINLPYEKFSKQVFVPNSDGVVEGIEHTYPYMYLSADDENASINVTYNVSWGMNQEKERGWDSFQSSCEKYAYNYAFAYACWNDYLYEPIREINLDKGRSYGASIGVFRDSFITDTKVPIVCTTTGHTHLFQRAKLITIKKLVVSEATVYTNWFDGTTQLANITFEGIIGQSIGFPNSPLTKASITNIVEHLSSSKTGLTVTIKQTAKEAAFTTSEWSTLTATKSNWTFSLV